MNVHVDTGVRAVHGGIELRSQAEDVVGTLGVLAVRGTDGAVVGLTVSAVAQVGRRPKVALERRQVELEPAEAAAASPRHADATTNVAALLSVVGIPRSVSVSDLVPGLAVALAPVDAGDHAGATVIISAAGEAYSARLRAYGARFYVRGGEPDSIVRVEDALEIVPLPGQPFVRGGDAGAGVFLSDGRLIGLVVAVAGRAIFAAPLKPVFESLRLRPLSNFDAVAHNRTVPQSGRIAGAGFKPATPWSGPEITALPPVPKDMPVRDLTAAFRRPVALPDASVIGEIDAFRAKFDKVLADHPARDVRRAYAAQWVRESMSRWLAARSNADAQAEAFAPIVVNQPATPNPEVLSVLTELAPEYLTEDVMRGVVDLMADGVAPFTDGERAALWRLVADFLANGRNVTLDLQRAILRAVRGFMTEPAAGHVTSELHAAVDAALLLPPSKAKQALFRQLVAWDADDAVLYASKFLLRQHIEQPQHLRTLVALHKDLFDLVLQSRTDLAQAFVRSLALMHGLPSGRRRSLSGVLLELGLTRAEMRAMESPTLEVMRTEADSRAVAALRERLSSRGGN